MEFIYRSIFTLFLLSASSTALAAENKTIFDRVSGDWFWYGNDAKCAVQFTTISFSDDYTRALFNYSDGTLGADGKQAPDSNYTVLDYDETSITMSLEGEKRTTEFGKPVKWVLVLIDSSVWIWRMQHWPETIDNKGEEVWPYRRIKCGNP